MVLLLPFLRAPMRSDLAKPRQVDRLVLACGQAASEVRLAEISEVTVSSEAFSREKNRRLSLGTCQAEKNRPEKETWVLGTSTRGQACLGFMM